MKKIIAILVSLTLFFSGITFAVASDDIQVFVNNKPIIFDVSPTIIEGRTVLPVRGIFESLGLEVVWDGTTKKITGIRDGIVITLQIDQGKATVNGEEFNLDVPATVINGRTLVPARFIAEATGAIVKWDSATRIISINNYRPLEVDGGDLSGYREANVVVNIGFGDRNYFAFTNEYGQLIRVTADEIILQDHLKEPVLPNGRYFADQARVPGTENPRYDKGHVIADSLGGVANAYNITPQDSVLNNHGGQAYMEKIIRDAGGCTHFLAIITYPNSTTQIPSHYSYTYTINGNVIHDAFDNVNPDEVNAKLMENVDIAIISVNLRSEEVVIKNASSESIQMKGYKLVSVKGNQVYTFPDYLLEAGKTVTVYSAQGRGDLKWTESNMWNNNGDPAELYDPTGNLISRF